MTATLQRDRNEESRRDLGVTVDDLIGEQVVRSVGTPADLLKVQVRRVGTDRYRVNVFVGKDFTSGRVANSYFLTADSEGNILTASPNLVRVY